MPFALKALGYCCFTCSETNHVLGAKLKKKKKVGLGGLKRQWEGELNRKFLFLMLESLGFGDWRGTFGQHTASGFQSYVQNCHLKKIYYKSWHFQAKLTRGILLGSIITADHPKENDKNIPTFSL